MLLDFFPKADHCSFATQFETKFTYVKTSVLLISFYCHYTIDIDAMNDLIVAYSTLQASRCIVHMDGTNRSETQKMTPFCHQKEYMLVADWRSLKHQNSLLSFGGPTAPSVAPQYRHPWGAVHQASINLSWLVTLSVYVMMITVLVLYCFCVWLYYCPERQVLVPVPASW